MDDFKYLEYLEKVYTEDRVVDSYNIQWAPYHLYPSIYHVNGLPIHFDKNAKKILIAFSGGADSTMLTYMLCKLIEREKFETKIHMFTMIRFWNDKPWLTPMATDVFNWLQSKFPNIIVEQHWGFIPPPFELIPMEKIGIENNKANLDALVTQEYQNYLMQTYNYEWIYSGVTMNPPNLSKDQPVFRNEENVLNDIGSVIFSKALNPFGFLRKNFTMAQYQNYQLDELLALTRSCEANSFRLKNTSWNGNKYPPECGHCFFCKEKQWGKDNAAGFLMPDKGMSDV
jgi:hypothetical protein